MDIKSSNRLSIRLTKGHIVLLLYLVFKFWDLFCLYPYVFPRYHLLLNLQIGDLTLPDLAMLSLYCENNITRVHSRDLFRP